MISPRYIRRVDFDGGYFCGGASIILECSNPIRWEELTGFEQAAYLDHVFEFGPTGRIQSVVDGRTGERIAGGNTIMSAWRSWQAFHPDRVAEARAAFEHAWGAKNDWHDGLEPKGGKS